MYCGETEVRQERVNKFLLTAKDLDVKGILTVDDFDNDKQIEAEDINYKEDDVNPNRDDDAENTSVTKPASIQYQTSAVVIADKRLKNFNCQHCDYKAKRKQNLVTHLQSIHEGVKYSCHQCGWKAKHLPSLYVHIQSIHHGVKYPCHKCDHKATQSSALKVHIKLKHNE